MIGVVQRLEAPICYTAADIALRMLRGGEAPNPMQVLSEIAIVRDESANDKREGGFDSGIGYTVLEAPPEWIAELNEFLATALQQIGGSEV